MKIKEWCGGLILVVGALVLLVLAVFVFAPVYGVWLLKQKAKAFVGHVVYGYSTENERFVLAKKIEELKAVAKDCGTHNTLVFLTMYIENGSGELVLKCVQDLLKRPLDGERSQFIVDLQDLKCSREEGRIAVCYGNTLCYLPCK